MFTHYFSQGTGCAHFSSESKLKFGFNNTLDKTKTVDYVSMEKPNKTVQLIFTGPALLCCDS